jgi:hypothetical protein
VSGASAVAIPAANLLNTTNSNVVYRIKWNSLSDGAACSKTSPDPNLTGQVDIIVSPLPQIGVSASPTATLCPGTNVSYNVSLLNSLGSAFNWEATDANGVQLGSGSNVPYGTNAINTNLGLSCPTGTLANPIKFTITPVGGSPLFCPGIDVIRYVTIEDITAPTWTTIAADLNRTVSCSDLAGLASAQALLPLGTDNCTSTVTAVKSAGAFISSRPSCPQGGTYTNTFTLTDACGNVSATYTQVITIIDTTAPTWTSAAGSLDVTYSCSDASGIAAGQAMLPLGTDDCASGLVATKTSSVWAAGSACTQAGTWTNSFTLTDSCGNVSSTFTQVITIIDSTKPTWTTPLGTLNRTVSCSDSLGLVNANLLFPNATDNCSSFANNGNISNISTTWLGNGQRGIFFDLSNLSNSSINIDSLLIATYAPVAGTNTYNLYKLNTATTYTAGLNNSAAWTLVGSQSITATTINYSVSFNQLIPSSSITLAPGEIRGFYLFSNTGSVAYLGANVGYSGANYFNDSVLNLSAGMGSGSAFVGGFGVAGSNTNFRLFYGKVNYSQNNQSAVSAVKTSGNFVPGNACPNAGTYTNTFIITDECGNASLPYTQEITIIDTIAPVLSGTVYSQSGSLDSCKPSPAYAATWFNNIDWRGEQLWDDAIIDEVLESVIVDDSRVKISFLSKFVNVSLGAPEQIGQAHFTNRVLILSDFSEGQLEIRRRNFRGLESSSDPLVQVDAPEALVVDRGEDVRDLLVCIVGVTECLAQIRESDFSAPLWVELGKVYAQVVDLILAHRVCNNLQEQLGKAASARVAP